MQDHTEGSSMHSQALETLQDRLREAETGLRREQDSYHQMQVYLISLPASQFSNDVGTKNSLTEMVACRTNTLAACPKWSLRGRPLQRHCLQQSAEVERRNSGSMTFSNN